MTSRLGRGPLAPGELIRTGIEIADALDRAHRQGVIHCDLKPSNIVLTESGAKLLDFGIARLHDASDAALHGTIAYTAPEVLRGEPPDARSDIFSFGATFTRWQPAGARSAATAATPFVRRSRPAHRWWACLTRSAGRSPDG